MANMDPIDLAVVCYHPIRITNNGAIIIYPINRDIPTANPAMDVVKHLRAIIRFSGDVPLRGHIWLLEKYRETTPVEFQV